MYTEEQIKRFKRRLVAKESGCLVWTGAKKPTGYGNLTIGKEWKSAHRVAWEINNGQIPDGLVVMHVCDNPSCCNPLHLVLGTMRQNMHDMIKKERHGFFKNRAVGERNGKSKLAISDVKKIRKRLNNGETQSSIACDYGVSQTVISSIARKRTWRHI